MVGDPPNSKRSVPNASKSIYNAYIFCKRVRNTVLSRGVVSLVLTRLQSAQYNLFHPMRVSRGLARTQKCFCKTFKCAAAGRSGSSGDSPEVPPFLRKFRCLSGSFGHCSEVPNIFAVKASFWELGINSPSSTSLQLLLTFISTNSQPKDFKASLLQSQEISKCL